MALTSSKTDLEQKLDDCIMSALDALLRNYPASDEFNAIYQEVSVSFPYKIHILHLNLPENVHKIKYKSIYSCHTLFIHRFERKRSEKAVLLAN